MQMCERGKHTYDESEYARCPYCYPKDYYNDRPTHVIGYDKKTGEPKLVPIADAHLYD